MTWNILKHDTWLPDEAPSRPTLVYVRGGEPWAGTEQEAHREALRMVVDHGNYHGRHRYSFEVVKAR